MVQAEFGVARLSAHCLVASIEVHLVPVTAAKLEMAMTDMVSVSEVTAKKEEAETGERGLDT